MGLGSGADTEAGFLFDEVEGVVEGQFDAEGACGSPGVAAPPEDLERVVCAGRAQTGDRGAAGVAGARGVGLGALGHPPGGGGGGGAQHPTRPEGTMDRPAPPLPEAFCRWLAPALAVFSPTCRPQAAALAVGTLLALGPRARFREPQL